MSHRLRRQRRQNQNRASTIRLLHCQVLPLRCFAGIVYSQPADTGSGQNTMTQLVYAVNHLKVGLSTVKDELLLNVTLESWEPNAIAGARYNYRYTAHDRFHFA
jgi:hypothetical protein